MGGRGQVSQSKEIAPKGKKKMLGRKRFTRKLMSYMCMELLPQRVAEPCLLMLGRGMGFTSAQWVTGSPPPSCSRMCWGSTRRASGS